MKILVYIKESRFHNENLILLHFEFDDFFTTFSFFMRFGCIVPLLESDFKLFDWSWVMIFNLGLFTETILIGFIERFKKLKIESFSVSSAFNK